MFGLGCDKVEDEVSDIFPKDLTILKKTRV